jgi:hypothetical protein
MNIIMLLHSLLTNSLTLNISYSVVDKVVHIGQLHPYCGNNRMHLSFINTLTPIKLPKFI